MPTTWSSYLPVVRQPMRFAVHGKEALDEGMESDPERAATINRAPLAARSLAVALPMPELAPVTRIDLPARV